ncbi:MAG: subclass B3 metallo-beta-lactamase [Bacteroidota bacterium]
MKFSVIVALLLLINPLVNLAQTVKEPTEIPAEWSKPYAPFRIAGNLYYVGTYDLACYLVVTPKGNILINTGLANSSKLIEASIATLGFKLSDTKILLTTQAHYDHMGAMAVLQKKTGARVLVNQHDAQVMKDGGSSDYALGNGKPTYQPLTPNGTLKDKEVISLGGTKLTMLSHPGHTKGSCSYSFDVNDGKKTYNVLIANMPSIVTEKKFSEVTAYPTIEKDYSYTLRAMKALKFDIWLSSHASQFNLHQKHKPGDRYNPAAFIDPSGYQEVLKDLQAQYDKKMKEN